MILAWENGSNFLIKRNEKRLKKMDIAFRFPRRGQPFNDCLSIVFNSLGEI